MSCQISGHFWPGQTWKSRRPTNPLIFPHVLPSPNRDSLHYHEPNGGGLGVLRVKRCYYYGNYVASIFRFVFNLYSRTPDLQPWYKCTNAGPLHGTYSGLPFIDNDHSHRQGDGMAPSPQLIFVQQYTRPCDARTTLSSRLAERHS